MKKNSWIIYLVGAILLGALAWLVHTKVHFQWRVFVDQLQHVDWRRIVFGIALILFCYYLRAVRWAVLVKPQKKVSSFSLLGSQVIGFTGVALFGRAADLLRPYLVARRTALSVSSQIGVYTVERMFDLAATALIFSGALLLAPDRRTLPHHEALQQGAITALVLTLIMAVFAISVRTSGRAIAALVEKNLGALSPSFGHAAGNKIRAFRDGLDSIATLREFFVAMALSLLMWAFVTTAYLQTCKSFILSPELSAMTLARCLVMMAASMAGSVITLPVLGWFTQIGITAGVMQKIFQVQSEPALACGTLLLIVTFMSVIPLGLIWARIDHVSLSKATEQSEKVGHEAEEQNAVASGI
ncbi:MAG: lysylphosphatidylglycerol synthase transmembrane domain-containing protein [Acidobacteriaceae bacterium]